MRLIDLIRTGIKNIWRRRLRSALTIIAVLIGSTAVVALLILAFGVRDVFISQLEATGMLNRVTVIGDPDAEVNFFGGGGSDIEEGTKLTEEMVDYYELLDNVIAVSPSVRPHAIQSAYLKGGDGKKYRLDVEGIRPHKEFDIKLTAGRNLQDNENDKSKVILGHNYLEQFGFSSPEQAIGKTLVFTTYGGYFNKEMELPDWSAPREEWETEKEIEAEIIGITSPGPTERSNYITEAWARVLRTRKEYGEPTKEEEERVQKLNEELSEQAWLEGREVRDDEWYQPIPEIIIEDEIAERGYDIIYVQVDNAQDVDAVAEKIEAHDEVSAITAQEFLNQILQIFTIVSIVLGVIGGIALLVAAVGIINTMVMAVMERTKEIGIMKAVGASKKDIRRLFIFEAGLLGFWGGVFGLGTGFGLTLIANYFVNQQLSGEGFATQNIANLPWWLGIGVVVFTTFVGIVAGLYPAIRAARMNPVDALRRE